MTRIEEKAHEHEAERRTHERSRSAPLLTQLRAGAELTVRSRPHGGTFRASWMSPSGFSTDHP